MPANQFSLICLPVINMVSKRFANDGKSLRSLFNGASSLVYIPTEVLSSSNHSSHVAVKPGCKIGKTSVESHFGPELPGSSHHA